MTKCNCPDPVPNIEGTICGKCGGSDPKVPVKKVKRRVKK